jgi:hypothetical protein
VVGVLSPHSFISEDIMQRLLGVVSVLVLSLALTLAAANPKKEFAKEWEGKTVVLKKPLYTFAYTGTSMFGGSLEAQSVGVTRMAPGKGIYYEFYLAKPDVDTDVQRLAQRSVAATGNVSTLTGAPRGGLAYKDNAVPPLQVITYDVGSELVIKKISFPALARPMVKIDFASTLAPRSEPVTHLFIEWPQEISSNFEERTQVEALMALVFEPAKQ